MLFSGKLCKMPLVHVIFLSAKINGTQQVEAPLSFLHWSSSGSLGTWVFMWKKLFFPQPALYYRGVLRRSSCLGRFVLLTLAVFGGPWGSLCARCALCLAPSKHRVTVEGVWGRSVPHGSAASPSGQVSRVWPWLLREDWGSWRG